MTCHYCGRTPPYPRMTLLREEHSPACPSSFADDSSERAVWRRGYRDGRAGRRPTRKDGIYMLGWLAGDSARDAAFNGS